MLCLRCPARRRRQVPGRWRGSNHALKNRVDEMLWLRLMMLLSLTLPLAASAQTRDGSDLVGMYVCDGINPDGSPYRGLVEITKYRDAFQVQWTFHEQVAAIGIGIRSGDVLAVTYFSNVPGVVAYHIEKGSRLVSEWTGGGAEGALFSETLTKATGRAAPTPPPQRRSPDAPPPQSPERP